MLLLLRQNSKHLPRRTILKQWLSRPRKGSGNAHPPTGSWDWWFPGAPTCAAWSGPVLGPFPPSAVILRKHTCAYHSLPPSSLRTISFMSHGNETQTSSRTKGHLHELRIGTRLFIRKVQMPPGHSWLARGSSMFSVHLLFPLFFLNSIPNQQGSKCLPISSKSQTLPSAEQEDDLHSIPPPWNAKSSVDAPH